GRKRASERRGQGRGAGDFGHHRGPALRRGRGQASPRQGDTIRGRARRLLTAEAAGGDEAGQGGGPLLDVRVEGHLVQREVDVRRGAGAVVPGDEGLSAGEARRAGGRRGGEGGEWIAAPVVPEIRHGAEDQRADRGRAALQDL